MVGFCNFELAIVFALISTKVSFKIHNFLKKCIDNYYIHTEKYSPKSYVVNFHEQMSSSQSVFHM